MCDLLEEFVPFIMHFSDEESTVEDSEEDTGFIDFTYDDDRDTEEGQLVFLLNSFENIILF